MDAIDLARWTPVSLLIQPPAPSLDWCDLSDLDFSEPFFTQTLIRIGNEPVSRELVTTGLNALDQIEAVAPGRDPDGFIFHLSRCGSTLVSQLCAGVEGVAVLAEAEPINTILHLDPARIDLERQAEALRLLIRAYGRGRVDASRFVVKFSSWNVLYLRVIRRAFPDVPCVFVARRPDEVVASILAGPPGWMRLRQDPAIAQSLLGIDSHIVAGLDATGFCVAVLERFLQTTLDADAKRSLFVDYTALPCVVWDRILPWLDMIPTSVDREKLARLAQFDAKTPGTVFKPDALAKRAALTGQIAAIVEERLMPIYKLYLARCSS